MKEHEKPCNKEVKAHNFAVQMNNSSYSWETVKDSLAKDSNAEDKKKIIEAPTLYNLNFTLKKGSLTGVAGLVGSGKSSLLSAMLGEMKATQGSCSVNGRIAIVAQQSWIFNGTVRYRTF